MGKWGQIVKGNEGQKYLILLHKIEEHRFLGSDSTKKNLILTMKAIELGSNIANPYLLSR